MFKSRFIYVAVAYATAVNHKIFSNILFQLNNKIIYITKNITVMVLLLTVNGDNKKKSSPYRNACNIILCTPGITPLQIQFIPIYNTVNTINITYIYVLHKIYIIIIFLVCYYLQWRCIVQRRTKLLYIQGYL